jgi:hypothetical protein
LGVELKTYRTFEMDIQDLRELLAEYFADKLIQGNKIKEQILTGLCIPGGINSRSAEETVKLAQQIDLRTYIERVLMEAGLIQVGESFRVLVRVTKQNLYDINEIQDICRSRYDDVELPALSFKEL